MMPKSCIKFISGYLIPSLNSERFGNSLMWLDKKKKVFQIDWCHKGGPNWSEEEAAVFVEWDKYKGHYNPCSKTYFTQSKQRFRAMLYKLSCQGDIKKQKSSNKFIKVYSIEENERKRRRTSSSCDSSEYESEEVIIDVASNSLDSDVCRRIVSQDNTINVLEDHAYVPVYNMSSAYLDIERELEALPYDALISSSLYDVNEPLFKLTDVNNCNELDDIPEKDMYCSVEKFIEDLKYDYLNIDKEVFGDFQRS